MSALVLIPPVISPERVVSVSTARRVITARTGIEVGKSTFYRWIERGVVRSNRIERLVRIPESEVERVILKCLAGK